MNVEKYTIIKLFTLFNVMFEVNEYIYISESYRDNGETYNKRKVFDMNKVYLGTIKDDYYDKINDKYFLRIKL